MANYISRHTGEEFDNSIENFAEEYSTSKSYVVGDLVICEGKLYKCITATSGAWDATKWEEIKVQDLLAHKQNVINTSNKLSSSLVSGLATVATSGNYNDLSNKPTIPTVDVNKSYVDAADTNLQTQIDAITAQSDVVDVVGTKAELDAYSKPIYKDNIVKVLVDSSHNDAITYYRAGADSPTYNWAYIGSQGPFYTKSEVDSVLTGKVSVNQGTSHAGEFLVVNSSGNVATQAFATMTGGSY